MQKKSQNQKNNHTQFSFPVFIFQIRYNTGIWHKELPTIVPEKKIPGP